MSRYNYNPHPRQQNSSSSSIPIHTCTIHKALSNNTKMTNIIIEKHRCEMNGRRLYCRSYQVCAYVIDMKLIDNGVFKVLKMELETAQSWAGYDFLLNLSNGSQYDIWPVFRVNDRDETEIYLDQFNIKMYNVHVLYPKVEIVL